MTLPQLQVQGDDAVLPAGEAAAGAAQPAMQPEDTASPSGATTVTKPVPISESSDDTMT